MTLTWNSITMTDWFHVIGRAVREAVYKDISYPNSSGREVILLGYATNVDTSKSISFQSQPPFLNCFKETSESAIDSIITQIQNKIIIASVGTLTFGSETHTKMMIPINQFRIIGTKQRVNIHGTVYYLQEFATTFLEVYS